MTNPSSSPLLKHPFRFYFLRDRKNLVLGLTCLLFTNALDALPPLLIGKAIDKIAENAGISEVGRVILLLIAVTLSLSFFRYLWRIFWGRFHHRVAEHLRNALFNQFLKLTPSFFQKRSVGELMSLINNDVNSFRMAIGPGVLILFDAIFILFIVPPIMLQISPSWTWKTLVLMPLVPFVVYKLLQVIHKNFKAQQDRFADMSGATQEIISGIRVIKSFAQEKNQTRLFNFSSRNYEVACNQVARADALFSPSLEIAVTTGSVILLLVGAPEVIQGQITIGSFFAFYQYIQRMVWPMTALGIGFNFIQRGKASFIRIREVLEVPSDIPDTGQIELKDFESLEFKNLSFAHPDSQKETLRQLSFSIKKNQIVALVGTTGSGKSSLIDLLCRFYPVPKESLFLNGIPVEKIRQDSLRKIMAVVPQDPFLFSRKISENLAYGASEVKLEEVRHFSKIVNIEKEIEDLPEAYDSYVGERGVTLSGGQKQRLTLARALLRKAPFVILDDSLSAVDTSTEQSILDALKSRSSASTTCLIVSNRISSIQWADHIIVLKEGEIESQGKHEDLLRDSPTYQRIYQLQSRKEASDATELLH